MNDKQKLDAAHNVIKEMVEFVSGFKFDDCPEREKRDDLVHDANSFMDLYYAKETVLERVQIEHAELVGRLKKLESFLETEKALSLGHKHGALLVNQVVAMDHYISMLRARMDLMREQEAANAES